jgi:long-chain acyl-CoA synthetase
MHPSLHSHTRPDQVAHVMAGSGEQVSYRQLEERSNRAAHALRQAGLRRGDVVALALDNTARTLEIAWAAQRSGLYLTCISIKQSAADIRYILADSTARALITSAPLARELFGDSPPADLALFVSGAGNDALPAWETLCAAQPSTPLPDQSPGTDMLYSSGTTGRPKGVKLPLPDGELAEPNGLTALGTSLYHMGAETVFLSPAPLYHAAPLRWCMAVQKLGGTVVIMEKFDAAAMLAAIEQYRVTHIQCVPTHFVRLLRLPEAERTRWDLSSLQAVFHAAAPCPTAVKEAMMAWWGPIIHEYYSGTESPGLTAIGPDEWLRKKGSVGRAVMGELRICDDAGNELPAGQRGVIYFANGPAFSYHNDPDKTAAAHNRHGWATLGDVGYVDDEGYLFLTDRRDFMIISGGVNIYPQEIENRLMAHPAVMDVAAVGLPEEEMGEQVVAVVQPVDWPVDEAVMADQLRQFCQRELGGLKTPRQFLFWRELPRQPTGKIAKKTLRAELLQG